MRKFPRTDPEVVLITGASSGFGRSIGRYLAGKGYRVFGTSRRAEFDRSESGNSSGNDHVNYPRMKSGNESGHKDFPDFSMIPMDVTDAASVAAGVDHVLAKAGRIDVAINNAGFTISGAVEEVSIEEAMAQFNTNFFGVWRVCQAVLPYMREQGGGCIINIGSLGGRIGLPFQSAYSASKFALEGLTEALRVEVRPFGIRVVLIAPGDFHTNFMKNRVLGAGCGENSAYFNRCKMTLAKMENDEISGLPPDEIAPFVEKIMRLPNPAVCYTVGKIDQRLAVFIKQLVPSRIFEKGLMRYYRLK
jgi:NAD(P)-dependent dehydrogenase (short-subunit alcohol dehydrogenase family)